MQPNQITYLFTFLDVFLAPIYFLGLLFLITRWKRKYYGQSPISRYIIPAFVFKIIGCVALAALFHFYYGYGDIFNYYTGAVEIWNAFSYKPIYGLELIFKHLDACSPKAQEFAYHMAYKEFSEQTAYMFRISGFTGLFCFGAYLPIAMIFTTLSFLGSWRIFKCFYEEFPAYHKVLAWGCLFVPTSLVWAGNILKDPLCIFGMGLMVTALYDILKRRFSIRSLIEMFIGAFILWMLKDYILYVLLVALLVSLYHAYVIRNPNRKIRWSVRGLVIVGWVVFLYWYSDNSEVVGDYVFEKFTRKTEVIQGAITKLNEESSSAYEIPNLGDYSPFGIVSSYLISLATTLFRPFLWESRNIMALLTALESTLVLLLSLWLFIRRGPVRFFSFAGKSPILLFGLVFTLLMAPLVGFISFNFGTLVRYKLPLVPFYYSYILLLWATTRTKTAQLHGKKETGDPD